MCDTKSLCAVVNKTLACPNARRAELQESLWGAHRTPSDQQAAFLIRWAERRVSEKVDEEHSKIHDLVSLCEASTRLV